ncbi:hypothetical protein AB0M54_26465 [Actinoplanes sp. NPDC051470]|uniref:hypothetical protein n=1 Tax=Actinoplanes sp. NPDC051470 TaxID=3157224 RepID=UPI00344413BF
MTDISERKTSDYELLIVAEHHDGPEFGQQTDLIKSSGASFDGHSKTWGLRLDYALAGDRPGLNTLFKAAKDYGTFVAVRERKVSPESP